MMLKEGKRNIVMAITVLLLICMTVVPSFAAEQQLNPYGSDAAEKPYLKVTDGTLAMRVDVTGGNFTGLIIPSWYVGVFTLSIGVYKWDQSYEATIAAEPVYGGTIQGNSPGVWIDPGQQDFRVDFERAFPEGTYLVVFYHNSGDPLHIPLHSASDRAMCYVDGKEDPAITLRITCLTDPEAALNDTPNVKEPFMTDSAMNAYGDGAALDGTSYLSLNNYYTVAQRFTADKGLLTGMLINQLFLASDYAEIMLTLYKWDTDYETTLAGTEIFYGVFEAEKDPEDETYHDFIMPFNRAFSQGDYLVVLESLDGVNLWAHAPKVGIETYLDDEPYEDGTLKLSYMVSYTAELNETPVLKPTPAPTQVPTEKPEATSTPPATSAVTPGKTPVKSANQKNSSDNNTILYIAVSAAAVVVIAAAVILIVRVKRKK